MLIIRYSTGWSWRDFISQYSFIFANFVQEKFKCHFQLQNQLIHRPKDPFKIFFLFPVVPLLLGIENGIVTKKAPSKCGNCQFAWMVSHFLDFQTIWNETHQTGYGECPKDVPSGPYLYHFFIILLHSMFQYRPWDFFPGQICRYQNWRKNSETNFDTDIKTSSKICPKAQDWNVTLCWTDFYLHRNT